MSDLSQYHLASSFKGAFGYPKVGEAICGKQILAAWVNKTGFLKGYKVQCGNCGEVSEFVHSHHLRFGNSTTCKHCYNAELSTVWFKQNYDTKTAKNLITLYRRKHEYQGHEFYEPWRENYKAFANYIASLENFDKWPEYEMDRIDNTKGYEPGNIRFATSRDNTNNRSITKYVEFNGIKCPRAEFIRLITGEDCTKIYAFISSRTDGDGARPLNQVLKELKDSVRKDLWPSEQMHQYYLNWYNSTVEVLPQTDNS